MTSQFNIIKKKIIVKQMHLVEDLIIYKKKFNHKHFSKTIKKTRYNIIKKKQYRLYR